MFSLQTFCFRTVAKIRAVQCGLLVDPDVVADDAEAEEVDDNDADAEDTAQQDRTPAQIRRKQADARTRQRYQKNMAGLIELMSASYEKATLRVSRTMRASSSLRSS